MRNNIAFRLSAQNSLNINEVTHREEKNLLNTFKAGSDLKNVDDRASEVNHIGIGKVHAERFTNSS